MADLETKLRLTREYERLIRETVGFGKVNSVPGDTEGRDHEHEGLDIGRPFNSSREIAGADLRAMAGGTVVRTEPVKGFGNVVVVERKHRGDTVTDIYGHLADGSIPASIRPGARLAFGDLIGRVGATGGKYTPHLHLESHVTPASAPAGTLRASATGSLWQNGKPPYVDPIEVQDFQDTSRYLFGIRNPVLRRQLEAKLRAKFDHAHSGEVRGHGIGFDRNVREEAIRLAAPELTIDQLAALGEQDFAWATEGEYWRQVMDPGLRPR